MELTPEMLGRIATGDFRIPGSGFERVWWGPALTLGEKQFEAALFKLVAAAREVEARLVRAEAAEREGKMVGELATPWHVQVGPTAYRPARPDAWRNKMCGGCRFWNNKSCLWGPPSVGASNTNIFPEVYPQCNACSRWEPKDKGE